MAKALVVYHNGMDVRVSLLEPQDNTYDSAAPHIWGLPDHFEIYVVIGQYSVSQSDEVDFSAGGHNVYIGELLLTEAELMAPPFDPLNPQTEPGDPAISRLCSASFIEEIPAEPLQSTAEALTEKLTGEYGLTADQATGMVGNLMHESGKVADESQPENQVEDTTQRHNDGS